MTKLLIIYHSRTGGTRQMAEAAAKAAGGETETVLKRAEDTGPDDLLAAKGYLFAAPENLAALSGAMKEFFDRCYYPVLGEICAGSDGENAARQAARIATGWRLKQVQSPLIICTHAQTEAEILAEKTIPENDLAKCRDLGAALGAGIEMGVF